MQKHESREQSWDCFGCCCWWAVSLHRKNAGPEPHVDMCRIVLAVFVVRAAAGYTQEVGIHEHRHQQSDKTEVTGRARNVGVRFAASIATFSPGGSKSSHATGISLSGD